MTYRLLLLPQNLAYPAQTFHDIEHVFRGHLTFVLNFLLHFLFVSFPIDLLLLAINMQMRNRHMLWGPALGLLFEQLSKILPSMRRLTAPFRYRQNHGGCQRHSWSRARCEDPPAEWTQSDCHHVKSTSLYRRSLHLFKGNPVIGQDARSHLQGAPSHAARASAEDILDYQFT